MVWYQKRIYEFSFFVLIFFSTPEIRANEYSNCQDIKMVNRTIASFSAAYSTFHTVVPWIEKSPGTSPPARDSEIVNSEEFTLVMPPWFKSQEYEAAAASVSPSGIFSKQLIMNGHESASFNKLLAAVDSAPIFVPTAKTKEIADLLNTLNSLDETNAFLYLRAYMVRSGFIQSYLTLSLSHATDVSPDVILNNGLFSPLVLKTRGEPHTRWGQRLGDGIYTIGSTGWNQGEMSNWGSRVFLISYENAPIFKGNNSFAALFLSIYEHLLVKFNRGEERYKFDGITAPFLPASVLSVDRIGRMGAIFDDLGILGVSTTLEVFLKRKHIPRWRISQVKN
jgi:hypothetical protein